MISWEIWFAVVPGLVLFLYGIESFSREVQRAAGERFRSALGRLANNRWGGALLGALVTAIIQSSTATTVITVGLVNAGTVSFAQSLGIMFGANVGTTITAQLIAFKLTGFAPVFIVLGFLMSMAGGRYRIIGKSVFYFGLVFFSLSLMSDAIAPIRDDPDVVSLLAQLSGAPLAVLTGIVLTVILQSSSVTTGIVVLLAGAGLIPIGQAVPIVLGTNIGTTATSLLASWRMDLFAKRAAVAHFLFNAGGVLLFLPLLPQFVSLVGGLGGDAAQQVANAHLIFNLTAAALFLLLLDPFRRAVEALVPGDEKEVLFRTKFLENGLPDGNREALALVEKEIGHALEVTNAMFDRSMECVASPDDRALHAVSRMEALNDHIDERVERALFEISRRRLGSGEAERVVVLARLSRVIEQLGDRAKGLALISSDLREGGLQLSPESAAELRGMYGKFRENLTIASGSLPGIPPGMMDAMRQNDAAFRSLVTSSYKNHLQRMYSQKAYAGSMFIRAVSTLEHANLHTREARKLSEAYAKACTAAGVTAQGNPARGAAPRP